MKNISTLRFLPSLTLGAALLGVPSLAYASKKNDQKLASSLVIYEKGPDGTYHWVSWIHEHRPRVVWVGEEMDLYMVFYKDTLALSPQWNIPGEKFKDYFESATSATLKEVSTSELSSNRVLFRWCDRLAGSVENRVIATAKTTSGNTKTQYASYRVRKPEVGVGVNILIVPSRQGKIHAYNDSSGHGIRHPGIYITGEKVISTWPSDKGDLKWVQMINSYDNKYFDNHGSEIISMQGHYENVLDKRNPYPDQWVKDAGVPYTGAVKGDKKDIMLEDQPATNVNTLYETRLDGILGVPSFWQIKADHSFTSYLMFKMRVPNARWVPLSKVNWAWNGMGQVIQVNAAHELTLITDEYARTTSDPIETHTAKDFPHWTENDRKIK